jgi:hypothetical protein
MDTQYKDTDVMIVKEDLGKNLYRKKTYYTLVIEQDVLAKDKDDADKKFSECGINHSNVNAEITDEKDGVVTYMVDANYTDGASTDYLGKVCYTDDEYAEENGDVEIDKYAEESPFRDYEENVLNENKETTI